MKLSNEFKNRATEISIHKGEGYKVADISKKVGYELGAQEMLSAVETKLKERIEGAAAVTPVNRRCNEVDKDSYLQALNSFLSDLSNLTPLK